MAELTKVASAASSPRSPGDTSTKTNATANARMERMTSALDDHLTLVKDAAAAADNASVASAHGGDAFLQPDQRTYTKESIALRTTSSSAASAVNNLMVDRRLGTGGSLTEGAPQIYRYQVPTFRTSTLGLDDSSNNTGSMSGSAGSRGGGGVGERKGGRGRGGRGMNSNNMYGDGSVRSAPSTNSKKGIDPPEVEVPLNVMFTKKLASKSQSTSRGHSAGRLPPPVSSTHGRGGSSSIHSSYSSILEKIGSSSRQENVIDGETDDDSVDDDYPIVSTDPVESDEELYSQESEEEPLTDHFDDDAFPPRRKPPVSKHDHSLQHRQHGSPPIQGRTRDMELQNMKQYPSSAPQRPSYRPQSQKFLEFLRAIDGGSGQGSSFGGKQGHSGPGAAGDRGSEGDRGILQLPFSSNSSRNPNPKNQQQQHHHHDQPLPQRQDKHSKTPRRMSDDAIHYLYTNGIDLLSMAANKALEQEEVDTLNDGINYLKKNLEMAALEKGCTASEAERHSHRKAALLPSAPSTRLNPLPPKKDKSDSFVAIDSSVTASNSLVEVSEKKTMSSTHQSQPQPQQQQVRVHRPPPPRTQQGNPSTPTTQASQRPAITAKAAMDYIMSASARHPSVQDDASTGNVNLSRDKIDEEVDKTRKIQGTLDEGTLDASKIKNILNVMIRGVDSEEGMGSIATIHEKNASQKLTRNAKTSSHVSAQNDATGSDHTTEGYDDEFDRNASLSLHAETKFYSSPGHLSKHVEDKHPVRGEQRNRSFTSNKSVDPPESDEGDGRDIGDEKKTRALGPRSQRPGGTTGVILDAVSLLDENRNGENQTKMKLTSQMESSSVDVPKCTYYDDPRDAISDNHLDRGSYGELIKQTLSIDSSCEGVNEKSTALMMKLCAHLLPVGIDAFDYQNDSPSGTQLILNKIDLEWNDDDPDEPGYIVHQLTDSELKGVETAFEKLVTDFELASEINVCDGSNDKKFERDLEEAELILDQEETRYESEVKQGDEPFNTIKNDFVESQFKCQENECVLESVPKFPGIFPSGKGIAGEMDCFYLPIITKSQKTGFEPTKDLVLKPGSVFANNYLVQSELGSAAFSTAYRCLDLSSKEDEDGYQDEVCLKVIKNTKDYFDQSLDEIKILQLLKDTGRVKENNIVEMKSFFYHREHLVIVTELLRQNLYEFGKSILESRGSLYFTRLRLSHITRQCLIALKFVHKLGLMHCDIKPENILLCSYSRALIKIIDFGSSSFVSDRQSSYIQSRSYRAPEVILGLPYDGKIDMWSLGCVVAEMYTNEVTFQNDSEISMLSRIEAICGPFPRHMVAKGRNGHRIFADSGLIYEKISSDEDEEERSHGSSDDDTKKTVFRVYQPKMTTIAARLGFDKDLMDQPRLSDDDENRAQFVDFVSKLLTIDPDGRLSAAEALKHPWIRSSLNLTEDDIRYTQG